jgi:hypothetical protein
MYMGNPSKRSCIGSAQILFGWRRAAPDQAAQQSAESYLGHISIAHRRFASNMPGIVTGEGTTPESELVGFPGDEYGSG